MIKRSSEQLHMWNDRTGAISACPRDFLLLLCCDVSSSPETSILPWVAFSSWNCHAIDRLLQVYRFPRAAHGQQQSVAHSSRAGKESQTPIRHRDIVLPYFRFATSMSAKDQFAKGMPPVTALLWQRLLWPS